MTDLDDSSLSHWALSPRPATSLPGVRAAHIRNPAPLARPLARRGHGTLNDAQLDTPYREGGWTVRQLVHHIADSHINSYVRFKLALTEDWPTIKPYDEAAWAALADSATCPSSFSCVDRRRCTPLGCAA